MVKIASGIEAILHHIYYKGGVDVIGKSLKYKFVLVVCLICFICLLTLSTVSYNISYQAVLDQTTQKIIETSAKNSEIMNNWFNQQASIVQGVAEDFAALDITDREKMRDYLPVKKAHYSYLTLLYVAFPDKVLIADNWDPPEGFDPTTRVWYKAASNNGNYFSEPYLDANTGNMVIAVSKSYKHNGALAGIVASDIDIGYITELVKKISISEESYAFLLDNNNNIVVHPNNDFQPTSNGLKNITTVLDGQLASLGKKINENNNKVMKFKDYDGTEKYLAISKIRANDWTLGIVVPESVFFKPLSGLLPGFIGSFLVSLILGILIILFLMNKMLKPVLNLTQVVKQFGEKKMAVRCEVVAQDEIGELSSSFNEMADMIQDYSTTLENKVNERSRELAEKNAKIQDSIEYAKMIQETILPENEEIKQIVKDYFVIWDPRDTVGGDFYWMKRFEDGFVILVGDCTGHGVPGALMTMAVNSMLNHIVNDSTHADPAGILEKLNYFLNQYLCRSADEYLIKDGLDAGVIYVSYTGKILFAGAQISLFLTSDDDIIEVKGSRSTIGCDTAGKPKIFENRNIIYEPGMTLYMATDGVKDQVGGEYRLPFGKKRLIAILKSIKNLTMEEQKKLVLATFDDYISGEARRDDITMLGFRI